MELMLEEQLRQAILLHKDNDFLQAEKLYKEILKLSPAHPHANHNLGVLLTSLRRTEEAIALLENAIDADATVHQFWLSYFDALIKAERFADLKVAIEDAKMNGLPAEKIEPFLVPPTPTIPRRRPINIEPPSTRVQSVLHCVQEGKFLEAEKAAQAITSEYPHYTLGWKILSAVLLQLNQKQPANTANEKAVELSPEDSEAHNNLSVTQRILGDLPAAKASSERAIALNPLSTEAHNNLGVTLKELGAYEHALRSFQTAIELQATNASAHNNLGNVLMQLGELGEAYDSYTRAIEINPSFEDALMNRWSLLFDRAEFDAALRDVNQCSSKRASACRLETLYALGRVEEVYERIENLSKTDPKNIRVAAFSAFLGTRENREPHYDFCNKPLSFVHFSNLDLHTSHTPRLTSNLLEELQDLTNVWEPAGHATHKGLRTPTHLNLFSASAGSLADLESILRDELEIYRRKFHSKSCSYMTDWPDDMVLHGWCVNLKKQGYQSMHIHPAGWLSGVVYLKVVSSDVENAGAIEFSLNGTNYFHNDTPTLLHQPRAGDIVLFPSSLHHRTIPFEEHTERVSIAFDLKPAISI